MASKHYRYPGAMLLSMAVGCWLGGNLPNLPAQTNLTVLANTHRSIGGVGQLDRAQFINYSGTLVPPSNTNLGNLVREIWIEDGLNAATGRVATELDQFIAQGLPEDPSNPGFFLHSSLIAELEGDYRDFVLTGNRWQPLRQHANPIFVQSGRNGGFFPDFLDDGTPMPTNYAGYADFLNVYLDEVVYGPNAFLPVDADRFYIEIMNEPNWVMSSWSDVIDMHRVVTELVKEQFPQAELGGPSCCDDFGSGGNNDWELARQMMDDMVHWRTPSGQKAELDFWVIHPYERYDVRSDGSYLKRIAQSPGHVAGIMDLYESYSHIQFGTPKKFAITEYGSWNRTEMGDGSYGSYTRSAQQWDLTRDIMDKMLVFMQRPDRIVNATPFVSPKHWQGGVPTNPAGDNVFWEQGATGAWQETIVAKMFRMLAPVKGEYIGIETDNPDLQSVAFRDGDQVYVILQNLASGSETVNLETVTGLGSVVGASWSRMFRSSSNNHYLSDVDVTGNWQNLALESEAVALLTIDLAGPRIFDQALDTRTFYGTETMVPITPYQLLGITVPTDTDDAVSATLRFSYGETNRVYPDFSAKVNGNSFTVLGHELEYDDDDTSFITREIDIPVSILNDGDNLVEFFFSNTGAGGAISSAVLEVHRSIGDYSGNGQLDVADLQLLYGQIGSVPGSGKFDLTGDNSVDAADENHWATQLRGASPGDSDVDGDVDTRDLATTFANMGLSGSYSPWTRGNTDGDNDIDLNDVTLVLSHFTGNLSEPGNPAFADVAPAPMNPVLIYDPATGGLELDANGYSILAFNLQVHGEFSGAADFSDLDADVGSTSSRTDNGETSVGWVSALASSYIGYQGENPADLGVLLPAGLEASGLEALLGDTTLWAGIGMGGAFDLTVLPIFPIGDFNHDRTVDAIDYVVWRDTLGSASDLRADADQSGQVDIADYELWKTHFGATVSHVTFQPVPELAWGTWLTWLLVLLPWAAKQ